MARRQLLKVVLLGDPGTGKTSLLERLVHRRFTALYKTTIGADFLTKDVRLKSGASQGTAGRACTLQLWDTAGQERFQALGRSFYRGADCCILVFDVGILESFQDLEMWRNEFLAQAGIPLAEANTFPFMALGNKIDIADEERAVTARQAQEWCRTHGNMPYAEVSAKTGDNVEETFLNAAELAMAYRPQQGGAAFDAVQEVDLSKSERKPDSDCAC